MEILGPLVVTGKITANAVAIESTSMEGLFLSASGDLTKRTLGTMALQASGSYLTSVGLNLPGIFNVTNPTATPANSTLTAALTNQTANTVFAAPNGAGGTPLFRALVAEDIPTIAISKVSGLQTALDTKLSGYGTANYLAKYTGVSGLGNSQVFDDGTNVGVGFATPASKLDVNGTLTIRSATIAYSIVPAVSVNGTERTLQFNYNSSATNEGFLFRNINAGTNLLFVQGNGNLGIGNITPAYKIDVTGTGHFTGNVTFDANAIVATAPTSGSHLTNKTYVDGKTWEIISVNGLQAAIDNKWTLGGNALTGTGYFGSTTNQDISFIHNGIAGLTLRSDGISSVKKIAVGRGVGSFNTFDSLASFGGNVTIGGYNSPAQGSYDLNFAAYTLSDTANNATRKARIKFGYYDAVNFVDKFKRTVEYWRSDDSIVIGSHTSVIGNLDTSAPVEASSIYIASDGATGIGQQDKEGFKLLVNGSVRFKSTLDVVTSVTSPLFVGGTGAASGLVYKSTSGVGTSSYHSFTVGNNGATEAMRIDNAGNVMVGTASTTYKFDVNGTGRFTGNVTIDANAIIATAPTANSHATNKLYVDGKMTGTTNYVAKFTASGIIGNSQLYENGTNVGVGHTSASSKLDIEGTLTVRNTTIAYTIVPAVDVNGIARTLRFTYNSSATTEGFQFYNLNAGATMMMIQGNGNVSIGGSTTTSYKLDVNGTGRFAGLVSCNITPTSAEHLTNKAYVDSLSYIKRGDSVRSISLVNITLSGTQTINGVALSVGDLILVAGQTSGSQNGVYVVASGSWTRSTNNDADTEIRGAYHYITAGTYINQRYINTNTSAITVGTTSISYALDFGSEIDPVWSAFQTSNDITSTRIGQWNTAYTWGNHASAGYVLPSSPTNNRLARFTGASQISNSQLFDDGTNVAVGHTSPASKFDVDGTITLRSGAIVANSIVPAVNVNGTERSMRFANSSTSVNEGFQFWHTVNGNLMFIANGGNVGIGNTVPAYKVDVTGTGRFTGNLTAGADLNIVGKLRLNNSTGVDHQFVKFDGTNTVWANLNTGELDDKNDIVMLTTDTGERGFKLYSDSTNAYANAFIFSNDHTGLALGLHAYAVDGSDNTKEFGLQIDTDGFLYHKKMDGSRSRLATIDMISGGGSGGGGSYSGSAPISVSNNIISIATASATQTGALSATDWSRFNNKLSDGGIINAGLNFQGYGFPTDPHESKLIFSRQEYPTIVAEVFMGNNPFSGGTVGYGLNFIAKADTKIRIGGETGILELFGSAIAFNTTKINLPASSSVSLGQRYVWKVIEKSGSTYTLGLELE